MNVPKIIECECINDYLVLALSDDRIMTIKKDKIVGDPDFNNIELLDHGYIVKLGNKILRVDACLETAVEFPEDGVKVFNFRK
jgi:hypothetical protein